MFKKYGNDSHSWVTAVGFLITLIDYVSHSPYQCWRVGHLFIGAAIFSVSNIIFGRYKGLREKVVVLHARPRVWFSLY